MAARLGHSPSLTLGLFLLFVVSWAQAQWLRLSTAAPPGALFGAASAYCPDRDSFIIFSGYTRLDDKYSPLTGMWEYSFGSRTWRQVPQSTDGPSARIYASLTVYPATLDNITCSAVLVGGGTLMSNSLDNVLSLDEVWVLELSDAAATWKKAPNSVWQAGANGAGSRALHRAVYRRGETIIAGGLRFTSPTHSALSDIWSLNVQQNVDENNVLLPTAWTEIQRFNISQPWLSPRYDFAMAISLANNPNDDRLVIFGGFALNGQSKEVLGDLSIFHFGTKSWTFPQGLQLRRASHHGVIVGNHFFTFGGRTIVRTASDQIRTFVFQGLTVTDLGEPGSEQSPSCQGSDGTGLWCSAFARRDDTRPFVRFDYVVAQRNEHMIVYGGLFKDPFEDFWAVNLTTSLSSLVVAQPDDLDGMGSLASTVYFMIAILIMMVVCFVVFVVSLRRHRQGQAIFIIGQGHLPQRQVGARPSFVESLPLKPYHKATTNTPGEEGEQTPADTTSGGDSNVLNVAEDDIHDMCAICLTDYEEGESLRELPCLHFFHPECIGQWLVNHNACPMCKQVVDALAEAGVQREESLSGMVVMPDVVAADGPAQQTQSNGADQTSANTAMVELPEIAASSRPGSRQEASQPGSRQEASANV